MKKIVLMVIIGVLCFSMFQCVHLALATSEAPPVAWSKTYGGAGEEKAYSLIQTSDGGYALVGSTTSLGVSAVLLVKTDAVGNMQWNKTYGRQQSPHGDLAQSIIQTSDGGYAFAGASWNQARGAHDLFLVKTDASGNMQWNLTYIRDTSGGSFDWGHAFSVIQTNDNGYIVCGSVRHHPDHPTGDWDAWVVRLSNTGQVLWDKPYFSGSDDGGGGIIQTSDGGYAFVGATQSWGGYGGKMWLVKIAANGNQQWVQTYGGGGGPTDNAFSVVQTSDGGYVIAGVTYAFGAVNGDFCLIRTDSSGNQLWVKTYGGTSEDAAYSMIQTSDGGYLLAGSTKSFGSGGGDFWLVKTDSSGNMDWNVTCGGTFDDIARSVIQTSDGGYAVAGYTYSFGAGSSDFWLVKLGQVPIKAVVDVNPLTLNLQSSGKWTTAYIELPEGHDVANINVTTIKLNGTVSAELKPTAIGDYDNDAIPDLMVKFDRAKVAEYILNSVIMTGKSVTVTLTINGKLNDGTTFQGSGAIRIIS